MFLKKRILFLILLISSFIFLFWLFVDQNGLKLKKEIKKSQICDHCNIVLVDIDILRADELPCYGYFRNTAPNLCSFAEKSVLFKSNFSTATWTLPSAFSTITSLYPTFHRVRLNYVDKLSSEIPTLAETLKNQGYYTVFIGGSLDNLNVLTAKSGAFRGYDLVTTDPLYKVIKQLSNKEQPLFIHYYTSVLHLPYLISDNEKVIDDTMTKPENLPLTNDQLNLLLEEYLGENYKDIFNDKAITEFSLEKLVNQKKFSELLKLFYEFHGTDNEIKYLKEGWWLIYKTYMSSFDSNNQSDVAYVRMMYDTRLKSLDDYLGQFLESLLSDNTVTVIYSDHGESFGEHGTFSHTDTIYDEVFYTPLIIHSPKLDSKVIKQTTSNIDIFPTILDLVNINQINGLQGKSLLNNINGVDIGTSRFVFSESNDGFELHNENWLFYSSLKSKLSEESMLFNRISDPEEKIDVSKENIGLVNELYKKVEVMRSYEEELSTRGVGSTYSLPVDLSQEKIEKLKKEGYF